MLELFQAISRNQPSVFSMLNNFVNSLPPASDRRLAARHGFKVDTSQAFEAAWQSENRAIAHGLRYFSPASSTKEMDLLKDSKILRQTDKAISIRAFTNDVTLQSGV